MQYRQSLSADDFTIKRSKHSADVMSSVLCMHADITRLNQLDSAGGPWATVQLLRINYFALCTSTGERVRVQSHI